LRTEQEINRSLASFKAKVTPASPNHYDVI